MVERADAAASAVLEAVGREDIEYHASAAGGCVFDFVRFRLYRYVCMIPTDYIEADDSPDIMYNVFFRYLWTVQEKDIQNQGESRDCGTRMLRRATRIH